MTAIKRLHVGKRMSEAVVHNGVVYLAGQVADDPSQDVKGQTRQVLAAVDKLLSECGSDKTRMLQVQIFLSDISEFGAMNEVWDAWIPQGHTPARATVEAKLAAPDYRVEIKVVAAQV
jgi:enamine deaminase RidA (YjgF/YER057c/UK114 family)